MYSTPTFIGVGAVKSGTTWLYRALRNHPEAWLPPIKELRYFNQPEYNLLSRLRGGTGGRRDYGYWRRRLLSFLRHPGVRRPRYLLWHLWYFFGPRSAWWYASLFPKGRCAGEISPLYAPIPSDKIRHAARHFPHLKILYLLRDPIDRVWSHIRMRCLGLPEVDFDPDRLTEEIVLRTVEERDLEDRWLFRHSCYAGNLDRWLRFFPRDQMFVRAFDDVVERPDALLSDLADFLGIGPAALDAPGQRANPRPVALPLPPDLETIFARRLLGDLRRLDGRFEGRIGKHVARWRERAERAARRSVPATSRYADAAPPAPN